MRAVVSILIMLPLFDPSKAIIDLFSPEETPLRSLRKRPYTDDPDDARQEAGIIEEDQLELERLHSMQDEEER